MPSRLGLPMRLKSALGHAKLNTYCRPMSLAHPGKPKHDERILHLENCAAPAMIGMKEATPMSTDWAACRHTDVAAHAAWQRLSPCGVAAEVFALKLVNAGPRLRRKPCLRPGFARLEWAIVPHDQVRRQARSMPEVGALGTVSSSHCARTSRNPRAAPCQCCRCMAPRCRR